MHPAVFEAGGIVVAQRNLPLKALTAQGGQNAQLHQQLKAVADAENQFALVKKGAQALQQGRARVVLEIAPAHRRRLGRAQVVAIQKPAGENEKMVVGKANLGRHQIGKMHHVGLVGSGQTGRVRGFQVRIGAVARDDQCVDRTHDENRETVKEEVYDRELAKDADWEDYLGEFASTPRLSQSREFEAAEEISPLEARYAAKPTLEGHLLWQLRLSQLTDEQKAIGEVIIGNLSSAGYLQASIEEVAEMAHVAPDEVRPVLAKLQLFDPIGVAARDARECLMVQIKSLNYDRDPILVELVESHLEDLEAKRYKPLLRKFKIDMLRTAEFILGQQSDCSSISVDVAHEVSETVRRLTDAAQRLDKGAGVIILTDMFGGTPTNLALSLLATHKVEVVTGVNLPMLLKVFTSRENELEELARIAGEAGAKGIVVAGSMLRNKARDKAES